MKPSVYLSYMDHVYTVYEEKSFTRAAEKLYISQSGLSMIVKKVENEIGYPIFEREGRNVVPTEIGEKLIKAIERIRGIQDDLEIELDELLKLKRGRLTIGTTTLIASGILPKFVKKFKDKHSELQISIVADKSSELEEKLENGTVDLIIDNVMSFNPSFKYEPFMIERILLGIPNSSPLNDELAPFRISHEAIKNDTLDYKSAPRLSLSGLGDEKFILAKRGNELRRLATLIFDENRIIPEISMEFERPHTAVSYAEVGLGLCFLTDTVIKHSNACDNISVYLPETIYSELTVYTVYQAKNYIPNALREFLDFIAEELSAEPKT